MTRQSLKRLRLAPDWSSWVVITTVMLLVGALIFYYWLSTLA